MNQRGTRVQSSFNNVEYKDIAQGRLLDDQTYIYKSSNQENWCTVWAPDSSYVAWSQGGGIVYLLPWNRDAGKLLKKPSRDVQDEILLESTQLISNLPRLDSTESESEDGSRRSSLTDTPDERKSYRIDTGDFVWSMAFGSGISESNIKLWRRFVFNRDLILATGLQNGKIKLWNVHSGNLLMELLDHKSIVRGLSFPTDGSLQLISCSNDCTIKFWDLNEDGNMCRTLKFDNRGMVFSCKWSPTCKQVAGVGTLRNVYIWSSEDWSQFKKLSGHYHTVSSCDFSPDGAILATASFDTSVILWDPYTGEAIKKLGHMFPEPSFIYAGGANEHYVRGVSFSKDGLHVVTVADDEYLRFWDISENSNPHCVKAMDSPLCCTYSPNGVVVSTGNRSGKIAFHKADKRNVVSLQHLCRMALRLKLPSTRIDALHYPARLKTFLKYKD